MDSEYHFGAGEWSEILRPCAEEGWWACFEKSVGVWSEGQEEARTTKENVEDASGEVEQECWFGEGGCHESRIGLIDWLITE